MKKFFFIQIGFFKCLFVDVVALVFFLGMFVQFALKKKKTSDTQDRQRLHLVAHDRCHGGGGNGTSTRSGDGGV